MAGRSPLPKVHKSIFDPIHGPITLDPLTLRLVATAAFQRLWAIRQTGFAHLVFPGANHTRLEHSLGTFFVAREMARRFGLREATVRQIAAAALLHDIGHAPFSHTLDGPMREVLGVDHERLSRLGIEGRASRLAPVSEEIAEVLRREGVDPRAVADLVDPRSARPARELAGSILHSAIDADRIDYLQRDAHYTGVGHGAIDAVRLLDTLRTVRGRPYFAEKGRSAVEGFLVGRSLMYASVYYHKTVRAAELMAQAAVERSVGYPGSARELFALNDGELLVRLRSAGTFSARTIDQLGRRRLYKRLLAVRTVAPELVTNYRALFVSPAARRQLEDALADRMGAPAGAVLVDLAGLEPRGRPAVDWGAVGVADAGRVTYPFRAPGPWRELALRPPAEHAVSVYVAGPLRHRAEARLTVRTLARAVAGASSARN